MSFKKLALVAAVMASVSAVSVNANADASAEVTLQGIITNTACTVTVNGGKSVLNVGVFKSTDFTANQKVGSVELPVTLTECNAGESGNLIIQGLTSVKNNDNNIFVSDDAEPTGFMVALDDDTTIVKNGQGATVTLGAAETSGNYSFNVGMATATAATAGSYSAPILVAYIVN